MPSSPGFPSPLPEKQPYRWQELTQRQKQVARLVHEWMLNFVETTPQRAEQHERGPFSWSEGEVYRSPNVVLIDGTRGSGKTSVMLTLLELWRRPIRHRLDLGPWGTREDEEGTPPRAAAPQPVTSVEVPWEQAWDAEPEWVRWNLIPVRPLDLHPLPREASLFAWIASRLLRFAELDEEDSESGERSDEDIGPARPIASWNPDVEHEPKSRRAWRDFIRDAASGWDSNLEQRKASLDPEAYAVELEQAETARHTIAESWQRFVDAVLDDTHARFGGLIRKDARLIIPIDDAEMNPGRTVEVLNAVRVLWHPRVVFLLAGDSRLFIKMLRLQQYGDLREKLHGGSLQPQEFQSIESRPSAHELAVQAYDKSIPPGQRFSVDEMLPEERVRFLRRFLYTALLPSEQRGRKVQEERYSLWARERGKAESSARPFEHWDTFVKERLAGPELGGVALAGLLQEFDELPFLRNGLPLHLRRIRNLAYSMAQRVQERKVEVFRQKSAGVTDAREGERQLEFVRMLWWDAVENQPFSRATDMGLRNALRLEPRELLPGHARAPGASGSRPELRVFTKNPVDWNAFPVERFTLDDGRVQGELCITDKFQWRLRHDDERRVPSYLTAIFLLALEVATDEETGPSASDAMPQGFLAPYVRLMHPLGSGGLGVTFHWPLPDWTTLQQLLEFEARWNERWSLGWRTEAAGLTGDGPKHEVTWGQLLLGEPPRFGGRELELSRALVRSFLGSILDAHEKSLPARARASGPRESIEDVIHALFRHAEAVLAAPVSARVGGPPARNNPEQTQRAFARWFLERALLLAAPESGLPASTARNLLQSWLREAKRRGFDPQLLRRWAIQGRLKRAARTFDALPRMARPENPEEWLARLDAQWEERHGRQHPWHSEVVTGLSPGSWWAEEPSIPRRKRKPARGKTPKGGARKPRPTRRAPAPRPETHH
ncbi:hypothetical protein P2318_29565 [Myxococcaceae bacterium GXIMD 01537]